MSCGVSEAGSPRPWPSMGEGPQPTLRCLETPSGGEMCIPSGRDPWGRREWGPGDEDGVPVRCFGRDRARQAGRVWNGRVMEPGGRVDARAVQVLWPPHPVQPQEGSLSLPVQSPEVTSQITQQGQHRPQPCLWRPQGWCGLVHQAPQQDLWAGACGGRHSCPSAGGSGPWRSRLLFLLVLC